MGIKGIFCVVSIGLFTFIAAAEPAAVWKYQVSAGFADASPAIVDLDNDGRDDIVLTTTSGHIIALDPNGRDLWQAEMHGPITIPPTAADLAQDGQQRVLVMNKAGLILCLDGKTGAELWRHDSLGQNEWGSTSIVAADLDAAPDLEVIAGDKAGRVVCLGADGTLRWNYTGQQGWTFSPAAGDVTGDGVAEVLVAGSQIPLTCLSAEGKELWKYGEGEGASPILADLDGDGTNEIIGAQGNVLFAVDGKGKELWRFEMKRPIDSAITAVDLNGDGTAEVYAADLSGQLVCISAVGEFVWDGDVEQRVRRSPSAGDVDGDGVAELLVAGYSGAIHVFTPEGYLKERVDLGGTANATASFANFAGDGAPVIVCPLSSGAVVALQWPKAAPGANVLWPQYRGDAARTGTILKKTEGPSAHLDSIDFGNFYVGSNTLIASVENPDQQALRLVLEVQQLGAPASQAVVESSDVHVDGKLTYVISGAQSASLGLTATLFKGDKILDRRQRDVFVVPFKTELATLTRLLNEVEGDCPKMADASGIRERAFYLKSHLAGYAAQADLAGTMSDVDRRTLRDDLAAVFVEVQQMHNLAQAAAECGAPVVVTAANPWAPFGSMDELAEGRLADSELKVSAFVNETESAAVNLFNMTAAGKTFRVTLDAPEAGNAVPANAVTLHEVVDVPTEMVDLSADALPRLNEAQLFTLPARGGRQLWLNVDTSNLAAGEYQTAVRLRSLDPEPLELTIPLKLTVWGAVLPDDPPLKLCHWGYVHSSVLKDIPEAALADQVAHDTDVFVGLFYPRATFDEEGNIVGEIDFAEHDEYVRAHAPRGIILFCGYQGALQGPGGQEGEAYGKAHVAWLRAWVKHLEDMGIGYERWALYPIDEPGLNEGLVDSYLRLAKLAREADPKIQMYTDPVGRITLDELKAMTPYVDIWCPNRNGILLDPSSEKLDYIKSTGAEVWTYECDGNVKHESPLGYYRGQSWLAWHDGLSGIGFWSYCTSQYDPWFQPIGGHDYLLIYQGKDVVTSKRWEAIRDGMEDHAMLSMLRELTAKAEGEGRSPQEVAAAKKLLGETATAIAQFCGLDEAGTTPSAEGPIADRERADTRWQAIESAREEAAKLIAALTESGG